MQFYARFQDEVVAAPELISAHVARSREQLGDSFGVIFDQALVEAHERLVAQPRDAVAKVEFVTTYHLVIEATLGLTAFEFITRYLSEQGLLPGFVEGYTRIHHDEQRHIGYGIWFLREAAGRDPELRDAIRATLHRLLPAVADGAGAARQRRRGLRGARRQRRRDPRVRPHRAEPAAEDRRRGFVT